MALFLKWTDSPTAVFMATISVTCFFLFLSLRPVSFPLSDKEKEIPLRDLKLDKPVEDPELALVLQYIMALSSADLVQLGRVISNMREEGSYKFLKDLSDIFRRGSK